MDVNVEAFVAALQESDGGSFCKAQDGLVTLDGGWTFQQMREAILKSLQ